MIFMKCMTVAEFDEKHEVLIRALLDNRLDAIKYVEEYNKLIEEFQKNRDDGLTYPREFI